MRKNVEFQFCFGVVKLLKPILLSDYNTGQNSKINYPWTLKNRNRWTMEGSGNIKK
jgi:hypothetical protein